MPIYTEEHAARLVERAGSLWRPSNGFEGDLFCETVCHHCKKCDDEGLGCDISLNAFFEGSAPEWVIGKDGQPKCTAYE